MQDSRFPDEIAIGGGGTAGFLVIMVLATLNQ
jgi:hypothetical protein